MSNFIKRFLMCFIVFCSSVQAEDRVVIDINKGVMKPVNIALHIHDGTQNMKELILRVIKDDLQGCFLFRAIPNEAFMQNFRSVKEIPTFALWRMIRAQYLMNAEVHLQGQTLLINMVLYDVLSQTKITEYTLSGNAQEWRKIAHMLANQVYERIVGEKGYFDTKILYVATQKLSRGTKMHRLAIMDQDGANHRYLTNGNTMVLTPRMAPNGKEFCFFGYKEKKVNGRYIPLTACIYRYNFATGHTQLVAQFKGMTYAPRYSPDGKYLIFSLSRKGASSIYRFDMQTHQVTRLTKGNCIDTSPCYSPDGKFIVFNSDRGGSQQLYIMNSDGSNIRRLSFGHARYAIPVWSPRGDWIAFTKFGKEGFFIGIIHPDGTGERMLASGYLVEAPTWSPGGRELMFSHQDYSNREKIFRVDVTGYNKHEVKTPLNAIDPEWSTSLGWH